jgi:hypothetical protein
MTMTLDLDSHVSDTMKTAAARRFDTTFWPVEAGLTSPS